MSKDLVFIARECTMMMYRLTDCGVPAIVARELGMMYRKRYQKTKELIYFDQFLLDTTYDWAVKKGFDRDNYTNN